MRVVIRYAVGSTAHSIEAELTGANPVEFADQLGDLRKKDNVIYFASPQGGIILAAREIVSVEIKP